MRKRAKMSKNKKVAWVLRKHKHIGIVANQQVHDGNEDIKDATMLLHNAGA